MKKFCFFLLISFLKTNRLLRRGKTVDPETRFLRSCISVGGAIARYLPKPRELQSWFWCICLIVSKMIRSTRKKRQKKKHPELGRHVFKKMVMISFASLFHNRSFRRLWGASEEFSLPASILRHFGFCFWCILSSMKLPGTLHQCLGSVWSRDAGEKG